MPRTRWLVLIAMGVFVLATLAQFPARHAIGWFGPDTLRSAGVEGSVWGGSATGLAIGNSQLENVQWDFVPGKLLTGKPAYRLTGQYKGIPVSGILATGVGGTVIEELSALIPVTTLSALAPVSGFDGRVAVEIDRIVIDDQWPSEIIGEVRLDALIAPQLIAEPLGDYRVVFPADSGTPLIGTVEDDGGPLKVSGQLDLSQREQYSLSLTLSARSSAPSQLRQFLAFLPEAPNGARRLEQSGRIGPLTLN